MADTTAAKRPAPRRAAKPKPEEPRAMRVDCARVAPEVNVREEPSMGAAVIGRYRHGDELMVSGTADGWCKVVGGGYVKAEFVG